MICIVLKAHHAMANRTIGELLSNRPRRSGFTRLLAHASHREAWTAAMRAFLPAELGSECQVANVRDHVLTVHLTTAAWATRFRFLVPDLLPRLNQLADFANVREVRIKVAPVVPIAASPSATGRPLPAPDAGALTRLADALDYGELKEAILRLARHGTTRPDAQPVPGREPPSGSADD
jgi:hypothetical protein